MTMTTTTSTSRMPEAPAERVSTRKLVVQTVLGFALLFGVVWLAATFFRDDLQAWGKEFVDRFGVLGMFFGTLVAECFHFPIPPQFYMLTAITTGTPIVPAMTAICVASLIGGNFSFWLGRMLGHLGFFKRLFDRARPTMDPLFERWGVWAIAVASITPIPFSTLCVVSGMYRIPWRLFALLVTLRVPRLIVFYLLIKAGWAAA